MSAADHIGAGHAATALSQMVGATVMISVPQISVTLLEDVPPQVSDPEEPVAATPTEPVEEEYDPAVTCF